MDDWGSCLEYKYEYDDIGLPLDVITRWKRYGVTSTFYDSLATEGFAPIRDVMQRISSWRLKSQNFTFPIEHKLFHLYVKMMGYRTQADMLQMDTTSGVTPHAPA